MFLSRLTVPRVGQDNLRSSSLGPGPLPSHATSVPISSASLYLSGSVSTLKKEEDTSLPGQPEGPQEQREETRGARGLGGQVHLSWSCCDFLAGNRCGHEA